MPLLDRLQVIHLSVSSGQVYRSRYSAHLMAREDLRGSEHPAAPFVLEAQAFNTVRAHVVTSDLARCDCAAERTPAAASRPNVV